MCCCSNSFVFRLQFISQHFLRRPFSSHLRFFQNYAIHRRLFCSSSAKTNKMQNPLDMATYRVEFETYRRNCPLERASTAAPAAGAVFVTTADEADNVADGDEQTLSPTSSGRNSSADVRPADFADSDYESPGKKFCVSSNKSAAATVITAEVAREIGEVPSGGESVGPLIFDRKTVEVVSAEDGWVYTEKATEEKALVETVRFDEAEQCFYDSLIVPTNLVGLMRGKSCIKQKQIEKINRCQIYFPERPKAVGSETEIKFTSTENALHVHSCGVALKKALKEAQNLASPTHFISVPIFDLNLREQYSNLVNRICEDETLPAELRNRDMFMKKAKLHLTINVLKLFSDEEVQRVRKFLDGQFKSEKMREILKGTHGRFRIEFETLRPMIHQSPEICRVLFAQPKAEGLQHLVNLLDDALTEVGLVKKRDGEDVLLHMTVLNTKYLWQGWRKSIDATQLLERYGQLDFDPIDVEELHLCEMRGSSNANDLNGYVSVHSIKFGTTTD